MYSQATRKRCPSLRDETRRKRPGVRFLFFFQAEDGIRDVAVTGVQTCALPILASFRPPGRAASFLGVAGGCGFFPAAWPRRLVPRRRWRLWLLSGRLAAPPRSSASLAAVGSFRPPWRAPPFPSRRATGWGKV